MILCRGALAPLLAGTTRALAVRPALIEILSAGIAGENSKVMTWILSSLIQTQHVSKVCAKCLSTDYMNKVRIYEFLLREDFSPPLTLRYRDGNSCYAYEYSF